MTGWPRSPGPSRKAEPTLILGTAGNRLFPKTVALTAEMVSAHKKIQGLTGKGKSVLLVSLLLQLLQQGIPVCLIDPHADLARLALRLLNDAGYWASPRGFERLLYVNFNDTARPVPFNALNQPYSAKTIASHMVETSKRVWPSLAEGAPQFENVLTATVMTLVENGLSLPHAERLLTDRAFREGLLAQVSTRQIIDFWHGRFDRWGREAPGMIESTLRRIFLFTFPDALRYTLGQPDNLFRFRELMDRKTSLIVNLGGLDAETQKLLGSLITVGFEIAALSREDIPEAERQPFHLLLDEASMFISKSEEALARVLSLARKYNLVLTVAHQTNQQLGERLASAFQNAVHISFALGPQDALAAARDVYTRFDPSLVKHAAGDPREADLPRSAFLNATEQQLAMANALTDLARQEVFIKVGQQVTKLRTLTVPPPRTTWDEVRAIEARYAQLYGRPRAEVAAAIDGQTSDRPLPSTAPPAAAPPVQSPRPLRPRIEPASDDEASS